MILSGAAGGAHPGADLISGAASCASGGGDAGMKLKRFAAAALAVCLMLTLLPGGVSAAAAYGDGWSLGSDGVLTVTKEVLNDSGSNWSAQAPDITQVVIGRDVTNVSGNAFSACVNLASFTVEPGNPAFSAGDGGVLYSADGREIVCYPPALAKSYAGQPRVYIVPGSVAKVCKNAFTGLVNSKRTLTIYALESTRESVNTYYKSRSGDDFPAGMIEDYIPVTGVSLDRDTLSVDVDGTAALTATVQPSNATFKDVTWVSHDTKLAKVTGSGTNGTTGTVEGVSAGAAQIVVSTADGGYTASCLVTVVKKDVNGLSLSEKKLELDLDQNKTAQLTAKVTPYNATYGNVSFISTDGTVAEIDDDGCFSKDATGAVTFEVEADAEHTTASVDITIKAVNPGTARIIATTADGSYFAVCEVTVEAPDFVLDHSSLVLTKPTKASETLTAKYNDARFDAVSWYSSDENIVEISERNGGMAKVTAKNQGTAVVVARSGDGKQQRCPVTVWDAPTGVGVSLTDLTLAPGGTEQLYAVVEPATADQRVVWSSSDSETVSVNDKGLVKAEKNSEEPVTITVTSAANGAIMNQCTVRVQTSVTGIRLVDSSNRPVTSPLELNETGSDTSATLKAEISPGNASNQDVTWISYNEAVATVPEDGVKNENGVVTNVVTAAGPGTTKILAVTADGGLTAECEVTVAATKVTGVALTAANAAGVTLGKGALTLDLGNPNIILTATLLPESAQAQNPTYSFTCDDNSVVTIPSGETGGSRTVTANSLGTANVTVTVNTADGTFKDTCTITVAPTEADSVKVDPGYLELTVGETSGELEVKSASNTSWKTTAWSSSKESVAEVENNRVKANGVGTALLTATVTDALDQKYTASCAVTVLPRHVDKIELDQPKIELTGEGETGTLTAKLSPYNATDKTVTFISTDPSVILIEAGSDRKVVGAAGGAEGTPATATIPFQALKAGTADIIAVAADGGHTARCTVTVYKMAEIVSIINGAGVTLDIGETVALKTIITPENAPQAVTWASDNTYVATVEATTGVVTAVGGGSATITATAANGLTAACAVNVRVPVTGVEIQPSGDVLERGNGKDTMTLTATVTPATATNRKVHWYSSDTDVALVDESSGVVTAKGPGTVAIVAVTDDGGKTDSRTLKVRNAVDTVTLDKYELPLKYDPQLMVGESGGLIATVIPQNSGPDYAADQSVTWEISGSNPEGVVTVSNGVVTALKTGTAKIIATSVADESRKSLPCEVTVTAAVVPSNSVTLTENGVDPVDSLTLNQKDKPSATLTAVIDPAGAKDTTTMTWESTDTNVATVVPGTGLTATVTAAGPGAATILATTNDGSMAYCTVKVQPVVTKVELNHTSLTIGLEDQSLETLIAAVTPYDAVDKKEIQFAITSGSGVIALAGSGSARTVVPLKTGEATVTVTATEDGGKKETCEVKVVQQAGNHAAISPAAVNLTVGMKESLAFQLSAGNIAGTEVAWSSSDPEVATVSGEGEVTAKKEGVALITAKGSDSQAKQAYLASCVVTVTPVPAVPVESITLNADGNEKPFFTLSGGGDTKTLNPKIFPPNATNKTLKWQSSDEKVAKVAKVTDGGEVTAVAPGTAAIVATTEDGGFAVTYTVTVAGAGAGAGTATGLSLNKTALSLVLGKTESETLIPQFTSGGGASPSVSWSTSDGNIATVDPTGLVTAKAPGTVTITASVTQQEDGKTFTATCAVIVTAAVTGITPFQEEAITLEMDPPGTEGETAGTRNLSAPVKPANATNKSVTWHSTNPAVASVALLTTDDTTTETTVTAVSPGTATIVATTADGGHVTSCIVTVRYKIKGISLDKDTLILTENNRGALVASVDPAGANAKITWASSKPEYAEVDQNGIVTAKSAGKTVITAATNDNSGTSYTATCNVEVVKSVTNITLNETELTLTLHPAADDGSEKKSDTLIATITPSGASNPNVTWMSTNESVATIDSRTGPTTTVTAVAPGKTTIIATTEDGRYTAMCTVTVPAPDVTIDMEETLTMYVGDDKRLNPKVTPFTDAYASLNWFTSDSTVAKVSNTGSVKAEGPGTAVITAATPDGMYTATCVVTVWNKTTKLDLKTSLTLAKGDNWFLKAQVDDGENPDGVTWHSSDPTVAKVENGVVTALDFGTAYIIAEVEDAAAGAGGKLQATCTVRVREYIVSDEVEAPTMTISDDSSGKIVTLSTAGRDAIWYSTEEEPEPQPYKDPIPVGTDTTIKAYAVRGKYQSVVVTGVINVTGTAGSVILTDKMGNRIENLAEAAKAGLSFTANINLPEAAAEVADIYVAVYDLKGAMISLEKFDVETVETEGTEGADEQIISQYLKLNIPAGAKIGKISLMVLSESRAPITDAENLAN